MGGEGLEVGGHPVPAAWGEIVGGQDVPPQLEARTRMDGMDRIPVTGHRISSILSILVPEIPAVPKPASLGRFRHRNSKLASRGALWQRAAMRPLLLVLSALFLVCCGADGGPGAASGLKRDEWGDGPGPRGFTTVFLDAGHGGHDSGAVASTTGGREKDLTLDTVRRVQAKLAGKVRVELIRSDDTFVDLDERVRLASRRDGAILVSIHYNSGPAGWNGPETYWWRVDSHGLASRLQHELDRASPFDGPNRGQARRRLRLTRNPTVPSVLVECGYLSHPSEAARCGDPGYRDRLASAIARAILDQQAHGDPPGPLPRSIHMPPSRPTDPPGS
jgi:N-acetylmuramoyl-L-alanine amidase